ncbi:MAG: hypothetical protein HYZ47_02630, partial [Simkania negevensis]|nr:hypothetical protein [Simkania negevensis]
AAFKRGTDQTKAKELAGRVNLIESAGKTSANILDQMDDLLMDPAITSKLTAEQLNEINDTYKNLAGLEKAMLENDYFRQAKIYKEAFRRYLASKRIAYPIGGSFYLFLRGLSQGKGVYILQEK